MFFYNAVKLWNNVSDKDLVCSSDVKKFKRNYRVIELTEHFLAFLSLKFELFITFIVFSF